MKMENEEFAMLYSTQTIYGSFGQKCTVVEAGPRIFKGNLVIAWKKDFAYGKLFNHQQELYTEKNFFKTILLV